MKPSGEVFGPLPESLPTYLYRTLSLSTLHSPLFLSPLFTHSAVATAFSHYIVPLLCTEIACLLDQITSPERKSSPKLNTGFADQLAPTPPLCLNSLKEE